MVAKNDIFIAELPLIVYECNVLLLLVVGVTELFFTNNKERETERAKVEFGNKPKTYLKGQTILIFHSNVVSQAIYIVHWAIVQQNNIF